MKQRRATSKVDCGTNMKLKTRQNLAAKEALLHKLVVDQTEPSKDLKDASSSFYESILTETTLRDTLNDGFIRKLE